MKYIFITATIFMLIIVSIFIYEIIQANDEISHPKYAIGTTQYLIPDSFKVTILKYYGDGQYSVVYITQQGQRQYQKINENEIIH